MKTLLSTLLLITLFLSTSTYAHTSLKASMPKNNAMLMSSPPKLSVTFTEPVRLAKLTLSSQNGDPVPFGFLPVMEPSTSFDYDLPALPPGNYSTQWMLLGEDGHKMDGSFNFMVHGSKSMQHDKQAHSQHEDH
ncbi:MAG: copper resistance protein CopC [Alteromonas sp.]|jgi:methionine-rich copper-binding protein CopC|uniref:copper resistance CopC family protein n=1 Tax=Alteromonas sp. R78001 TaxID=3093865 RepID=UPI00020A67EA|nr:copper resistance protein CopC [Glaciecola sp. 4H-3-7+YE-5]MAB94181.1 copper resistance protein CopC [Alteromonas sp.]